MSITSSMVGCVSEPQEGLGVSVNLEPSEGVSVNLEEA